MKTVSLEDAELIALAGFEFLGDDQDRIDRFLTCSGLTFATLRDASRSPGFLAGVLDYFSSDEALLTSFAAWASIEPERVGRAAVLLSGHELER